MRDHPSHSDWPMSGGMWGGTRDAMPDMMDTIKKNAHSDAYVMDMQFLKDSVWPRANDAILQHDAFSWYVHPYHYRYYCQ